MTMQGLHRAADTETFSVDTMLPVERARLVQLCARLSGDPEAAEDLAQETLLEAWRGRHKLRDAAGRWPWLAAIARNICLRWARSRGRALGQPIPVGADGTSVAPITEDWPDTEGDVALALERDELAALLDRALALLPPFSREILVERCILELPQAEVAARLGLSEGAVAVRLHRGKLALRRVLAGELQHEAAAYGLPVPDALADPATARAAPAGWRETRIWCSICGQRRLLGRFLRATGEFALRCPDCCPDPDDYLQQTTLRGTDSGFTGYGATLARVLASSDDYYRGALVAGTAPCPACGRLALLRRCLPETVPASWRRERGLHLYCEACDAPTSLATVRAIALALPEGRRFWRRHPRIRSLPCREIAFGGRAALLHAFQSVTGAARLEVISARDTYAPLAIEETSGG